MQSNLFRKYLPYNSEEILLYFPFLGVGRRGLREKQFVIKCIHFLLHCCSSFDVIQYARMGVH